MKFKKNLILYVSLIIIVFALQFILSNKHLLYGFNNDDWYVLAWYKQVVSNPLLDILKAWKSIGPHNFTHAYYIGLLFEVFNFNYQYYHIFNTVLKVLAVLTLFPLVYFLFKSRLLAFLATIIFAFHVSPFGALNNVLGGSDALMVASINLFLALYVWASKRKLLNNLKILFFLLILLLLSAIFDVTRSYPFIISLPLLELVNFFVNRQSDSFKAIFLRLLFLYSPFLVLVAYSPGTALKELSINKLITLFQTGNYQLFISLFASFGSTFVHAGLIDKLSLGGIFESKMPYQDLGAFLYFLIFRFLIFFLPVIYIASSVVLPKPKRFIVKSLSLNIFFVVLAAWAANHWLYLDPKLQAAVDPRVYFILGLIGLSVISASIGFLTEWLKERSNYFLLTLALAPIFSLLYTFLTWIMVSENAIFVGVHAYLNVAAIGSSIYLSIFLYLAYKKLTSGQSGTVSKLLASFVVIYFFIFFLGSFKQIDGYYDTSLKGGFSAEEQQKIHNSFWKEVGFKKPAGNSATLIFLDGSQDIPNGFFYSNAFIWNVPSMLTIRRGEPFDPDGYCKTVVVREYIRNLRIDKINGKDMLFQTMCGKEYAYSLENFYAFKMVNKDLIPIKSEIIKELEAR